MKILETINVRSSGVSDQLIIFTPNTPDELSMIYSFRYRKYLSLGYIESNINHFDVDKYDEASGNIFHIAVFSKNQNRILGYVRIISTSPLPIEQDCYNFRRPMVLDIIKSHEIELSRLISDKYDTSEHLPRHLVVFLLMGHVLKYAKNIRALWCFSFVKFHLLEKMRSVYFPYFRIRNYTLKYREGPLKQYFLYHDDPVYPIFYFLPLVRMYVNLAIFIFRLKHVIY